MPKLPWEDLDQFLDDKTGFAITAELVPHSGAARSILGIFDEPSITAEAGRQYQHDTTNPTFQCKEESVAGVVRYDTLIIAGRSFDILEAPAVDGTGWAVLKLAAAAGSEGR